MITRDASTNEYVFPNGERIPARTECAGKMLEWTAYSRGLSASVRDHEKRDYEAVVEFPFHATGAVSHWSVLLSGVQEWSDHEPTIALAQRRVLAVLAALTQRLEG